MSSKTLNGPGGLTITLGNPVMVELNGARATYEAATESAEVWATHPRRLCHSLTVEQIAWLHDQRNEVEAFTNG